MKKRVLALVLAGAMAAGMTACGAKKEEAPAAASEAAEATSEAAEEAPEAG